MLLLQLAPVDIIKEAGKRKFESKSGISILPAIKGKGKENMLYHATSVVINQTN